MRPRQSAACDAASDNLASWSELNVWPLADRIDATDTRATRVAADGGDSVGVLLDAIQELRFGMSAIAVSAE